MVSEGRRIVIEIVQNTGVEEYKACQNEGEQKQIQCQNTGVKEYEFGKNAGEKEQTQSQSISEPEQNEPE